MKFMILVKASPDSEAGRMPSEALFKEMADYHQALMKAGILVDASGLQRTENGWRIRYEGKKRTFVDGPFTETRELVAGYTIIEVRSRAEALEWTRRFPNPAIDGGIGEIEVRPYFDLEAFGPSEQVERFHNMVASSA